MLGQLQENGRCSSNGPCKEEIAGRWKEASLRVMEHSEVLGKKLE